ncbi:MAG: tetratricopeptide repeat protein [Anaerolineaceae bacterium]|nr:tetratricopeptide repeat protein [Anaerolineaceae bacterium]
MVPRRRADLLSRQRLIDLLNELLELKLVIVAAPAGYGKTSLLVDFFAASGLPPCWLSLDPLDQDIPRFLAHFIACIRARFPRFGKVSLGVLQNTDQDQLNLDALVAVIANDAYQNISEHFAIVIDDYHLVEESRSIPYFLNQFVQRVDENCHVVIASRTLLNLPDMPLLVARSLVGGLSFEELAFQPREIQDLWLKNYRQALSEEEAGGLAEKTEGWITGLLLTRQVPGDLALDRLKAGPSSDTGLYEYLAQQVLSSQPQTTQNFLLWTSFLEEFDAPLCEEVLPAALGVQANWAELVEQVLRANLFIQTVGDDHIWLRYHHLFRDFLQQRLVSTRPEQAEKIQLRLAEHFIQLGEWERVFDIYKRFGDPLTLADLIEQAGETLVTRGRWSTISEWLGHLPAEIVRQRPSLIALRGVMSYFKGDFENASELLSQAAGIYQEKGQFQELAKTIIRRAAMFRMVGNLPDAQKDAELALSLANQHELSPAIHADALFSLGTISLVRGEIRDALGNFDQAQQIYAALNDQDTLAKVAQQEGMASKNLGLYPEAEQAYRRALDHFQATGNLSWQANLLNNLGVLQHMQGDFEEASASFEKAVQYARLGSYFRLEAYALASIGDLYHDADAAEEALEAYRQSRPIALRINDRSLLFYLDIMEAALVRAAGQFERAAQLLKNARHAFEISQSASQEALFHLERGRLLVEQHRCAEALGDLRQSVAFYDRQGHSADGLSAHLYLAVAEFEAGDRGAAWELLHGLQTAAVLPDTHYAVAVCGHRLHARLEALLKDVEFEQAASVILRQVERLERRLPAIRRVLRRQVQTVPLGPPKLIIHTLGKIQVRVNGKLVTLSDWQAQTARDLFLLLVAHPEGLEKEEIGEILWPDSTTAELKLRFKNNIYRVRRAIGKEAIIFDIESYRFNRDLDYEEDAEAFLREIDIASHGNLEHRIYHYRAALKYYKGDYLPELSGFWVVTQRQHLYEVFMDALLKLADLEIQARQFDTALNHAQRALSEDRCLEVAYRLAMHAYAGLGNRAGVMRQYEACCQALEEEFHAKPSEQTRQLFTILTK